MKKSVLIGYRLKREGFSALEQDFELIYPENERFTKEEILERISGVDVFVPAFGFQTNQEIIDAGKNLKLITNFGVGYDNIDTEYAAQKGIAVTNTPHAVLEPTAELCFSLLTSVARRIPFYDRLVRHSEKAKIGMYEYPGVGLYGKTLGIFGMGRIGQAVARRAIANGMKIIYHNRKPLEKEVEKKYQAMCVSFEELLVQSDFLSLNAPATPETFHILNAAAFAKMKKTAFVVNTARGTLIDEEALVDALQKKRIGGAALDVYEHEPLVHPALKMMDNVVLAPHVGTQTIEAKLAIQREVADNIIGFFAEKAISRVN